MDFDGIDAEWHFFFATSHGKGPCDGIGGTVKRLAAKASLQRPYSEQIMTPRQLFQFDEDNISGISFFYWIGKRRTSPYKKDSSRQER